MSGSAHPTPPFSPVLLAGFLMRPLPAAPLAPLLRAALGTVQRRHGDAFERLAMLDDTLIVIDPVDLPFCLAIDIAAGRCDLRVAGDDDQARAMATIRGPLLALIDLLEGRIDGDALFFSRDIMIEGDTETIVMLRNTLDGADINVIADLTSGLGPLAKPAAALAGRARILYDRFARDVEALGDAIVAPLTRRAAGQEAALGRLDDRVAQLEQGARPRRRATAGARHGR